MINEKEKKSLLIVLFFLPARSGGNVFRTDENGYQSVEYFCGQCDGDRLYTVRRFDVCAICYMDIQLFPCEQYGRNG